MVIFSLFCLVLLKGYQTQIGVQYHHSLQPLFSFFSSAMLPVSTGLSSLVDLLEISVAPEPHTMPE